MKIMIKPFVAAVLVGILSSANSTQAEDRAQGGFAPSGPPAFIRDLPNRFGVLVAADVNRDRQLDVDELAALAAALEDGSIERPEGLPVPPEGMAIPYDLIALKLGEVYEALAPYDSDLDGELTQEERFAIFSAIMSGELEPPFLQFRKERQTEERRFQGRRGGRRPFGRIR